MVRTLSTLVLLLATSSLASAADERRISEPCRLSDPHTGSYDLRPLQRKGRDYNISNPATGATYAINFCGPITSQTWAVRDPDLIGSYTQGPKGGISLGNYETTPVMMNGALTLSYVGGDYCPNSNAKRSTLIYLQCDSSWTTQEPTLISSIEDCFYVFLFKTPHACPTSFVAGVFSSIVVFFAFILTALLVSFASALTYNRYVLHQRGSAQVPSMDKARELLEMGRDLVVIAGIWLLDMGEKLVSFLRRPRGGSAWSRGGSSSDYTRGAWSRSARDGFSASGLEGGGSLLADDSDEEDDEAAPRMDSKKPLPSEPAAPQQQREGELFKVADDDE